MLTATGSQPVSVTDFRYRRTTDDLTTAGRRCSARASRRSRRNWAARGLRYPPRSVEHSACLGQTNPGYLFAVAEGIEPIYGIPFTAERKGDLPGMHFLSRELFDNIRGSVFDYFNTDVERLGYGDLIATA